MKNRARRHHVLKPEVQQTRLMMTTPYKIWDSDDEEPFHNPTSDELLGQAKEIDKWDSEKKWRNLRLLYPIFLDPYQREIFQYGQIQGHST